MDLALNNLQWLICHKTQPTNLTNFVNQVLYWLHVDEILILLPSEYSAHLIIHCRYTIGLLCRKCQAHNMTHGITKEVTSKYLYKNGREMAYLQYIY